MKTLKFKCTLLTDVILNQRAATEGNFESLDFIPGNNFLGVAAGVLYKDDNTEAQNELCRIIFHSGKVRFGDAHPIRIEKYTNGQPYRRSLRVPASMYQPKDGSGKPLYIHHAVTDSDKPEFKAIQPKQCRTGFYIFEKNCGIEVKVNKSFAIKSAYDRDKRRSKDQMMYGYESLLSESNWIFEITVNEDITAEIQAQIKNALTGKKRIGRSRTAQYGLVNIEEMLEEIKDIESIEKPPLDYVLVYADARLIFLDDFGLPTFQPKAEDLKIMGGVIDWKKSQIRTFQYAPWNFKRQVRDAERCGIEKGSVFYVGLSTGSSYSGDGIEYVGCYQNEGFGKVLINPDFLSAKEGDESNGLAIYQLISEKEEKQSKDTAVTHDSELFTFLKEKEKAEQLRTETYKLVNKFINDHGHRFKGEKFASQWGSIRQITIQHKTKAKLEEELFTKTVVRNGKKVDAAYLTSGVAKDKWDEKRRFEEFKKFFDEKLNEANVQLALINLAAEMAKICRNNQ